MPYRRWSKWPKQWGREQALPEKPRRATFFMPPIESESVNTSTQTKYYLAVQFLS
jgi:hypothetical protein